MGSSGLTLPDLEAATREGVRFTNLTLGLRRRKTHEIILIAGGIWDRWNKRFSTDRPKQVHFIDLEESQVEFTMWFAKWMAAFRDKTPRDVSLALAGGERRGGKTFDLLVCSIAAVLDVPGSLGWAIAKNFRERDEIDRTIWEYLPRNWFVQRRSPDHVYIWANGSTTKIQSAHDTDSLKQGRADIVFLNEAQKMSGNALVNALGGTIDKGGIALCAANPPRRSRGEWVLELKEAIEERRIGGCKFFGFSSKNNTQIDHEARSRFAGIVRVIDPGAADADAEGEWLAIAGVAYQNFKRLEHVRPMPEIGTDVTGDILKRKAGRPYKWLAGVDFQATPHHAGALLKFFRAPDDRLIFWVGSEVIRHGTEDEFLDAADEMDLAPENTLWIGDASGEWQDGRHSGKGRCSFDCFKQRRWHIKPPTLRRTERAEHPKNPAVEDRVSLVNNLLAQGRLFVDPVGAPQMAMALKKCQLKNGKPYGEFAHITDALGYALWWIEPRPRVGSAGKAGVLTMNTTPRGPRMY